MLSTLRVQNFKSLRDVELPLRDLTLLVGWNASGKSNVLEALELVCWTARTPRLTDISHAMELQQVRIRGNVRDLAPFNGGSGVLAFVCEITPGDASPPLTTGRLAQVSLGPLTLSLELEQGTRGLRVHGEALRAPSLEQRGFRSPLYQAKPTAGSSLLTVSYQNFRRATKPSVECTDDQPCFVQLATPARFDVRYEETREAIPAAARLVAEVLSSVCFLDPSPRAMRGYAFKDDDQLHINGDNVSAVLHRLVAEGRGAEVLAFVRDLPETPFLAIDFLQTPRNEVMVVLHEGFGSGRDEMPAALMSDGTLRVLAVAAALLSAPPGALVVIEEIDNGVHPSRASSLLRTILATARRRGVQVLVTTHNPALQDALPDEVLPDVVLAYRDPDDGATRLTRLGDLEGYPRIVAGGPLGRLVTQDSFERMVKRGPGAQATDLGWIFDGPEEDGE